jgi:hypothetical protein
MGSAIAGTVDAWRTTKRIDAETRVVGQRPAACMAGSAARFLGRVFSKGCAVLDHLGQSTYLIWR